MIDFKKLETMLKDSDFTKEDKKIIKELAQVINDNEIPFDAVITYVNFIGGKL